MALLGHLNGSGKAQSPSPQILKAAKSAVASPHALINLTRLVKSLDTKIPTTDPDDSPLVDLSGVSVVQRRKDWEFGWTLRYGLEHGSLDVFQVTDAVLWEWESVALREGCAPNRRRLLGQLETMIASLMYARAFLDLLKDGNEGSSSSSRTITELNTTLTGVTARYEATVGPTLIPSSRPITPVIGSVPSATAGPSATRSTETSEHPSITPAASSSSDTAPNLSTTRRRQRPAPSLSEYLSKREREDARGGEAGLLSLASAGPVRSLSGPAKTQRDQLLAGQRSEGVMGNSQLHEELGGQLAEMSHRLKLNAIHFSNSLEAEKSLLDSSQQTLESNLTGTQASKKHLGSVSSKGRGTTCLTLGIILLVLIIFVWTYMLIRFT